MARRRCQRTSADSPPHPPGTTRRRHRGLLAVGLGVLVIGSLGVAVKMIWLTDSSRPISVEEAVDEFRSESTLPGTSRPMTESAPTDASNPSTAPVDSTTPTSLAAPTSSVDAPSPVLPEPGVYRYATSGGETIDAMGGVDRTYPAETTITVTPHGCGVRLEWIALDERREEWELCLSDGGVALQPEGAQFHEFFGQAQLDEVRCEGVLELITTAPLPTAPVARSCTLADEPWTPNWTVVERTRREVDETTIAVTRVRMTVADADDYWEDTSVEWDLADSGLPVTVRVETTSRSSSVVGAVVYEEAYELELESLIPLT